MKIIVLTYRAFEKESTVRQEFLGGFQNLVVQAVKLVFRCRQWRNLNIELLYRPRWLKILPGILEKAGNHRAKSLQELLRYEKGE